MTSLALVGALALMATSAAALAAERNGVAEASPEMMALLQSLKDRNGGSSVLQKADIAPLREQILADGVVDGHEADMVRELTYEDLRVITIFPAGAKTDFSSTPYLSFATLRPSLRDGLASLGAGDFEALWDEADRTASLGALAGEARRSDVDRLRALALLKLKIGPIVRESSQENAYAPFRALVADMVEAGNALPPEHKNAARALFHDAVRQANEDSGASVPHFLYNWLRPA